MDYRERAEISQPRATPVRLELSIGRPRAVFEGDYAARGASGLPDYDVHPDGERFIMIRERTLEGGAEVNLILDWFTELEELEPDGG